MNKKVLFLIAFAYVGVVASKGVIERFGTDIMEFGLGASGDNKTLTVNVGDGASNPRLTIDATTKDFEFNKNLSVLANEIKIGDGTNSNTTIINNDGSGTPPKIEYSDSLGAWTFSNDGTLVKKFGSGSGSGGGGVNFLSLAGLNNAFEDGFDVGWSGTALVATEANSGNQINGEKSLVLDTTTQGDFYEMPAINLIAGAKGVSCEFNLSWIGGDSNVKAQLINGNAVVVAEVVLSNHISKGSDSDFFACPGDASIIADPNVGNFKVRLEQTETTNASAITIDDIYFGELQSLSEAAIAVHAIAYDASIGNVTNTATEFSSDSISGNLTLEGGGIKISQGGEYSIKVSANATGNGETVYLGYSVNGSVTEGESLTLATNASLTRESLDRKYIVELNSGDIIKAAYRSSLTRPWLSGTIEVEGSQAVQVYKSIPKVADNVSYFSAKITSTGVVSGENTDWISGNCTSAIPIVCTFNANVFSLAPNCSITRNISGQDDTPGIGALSSTSIAYSFHRGGSGEIALSSHITCQKSDSDFKMPTVQPIIVGQVTNSSADIQSKNYSTESCVVLSTGTGAMRSDCSDFITTSFIYSTNKVRVTFKDGVFTDSDNMICDVNRYVNIAGSTGGFNQTGTVIYFDKNIFEFSVNDSAGNAPALPAIIKCEGVR